MILRENYSGRRHQLVQPLCLLLSIIGVGCSATTHSGLERARASYSQAQQNSEVATYAPVPLREAQQSLQRAEQVWQNDKDNNEVTHLAYVTEQQVAIARTTAEKRLAEVQIEQLSQERERVLLSAREREAQQANLAASEARLRAEQEAARARQLEQQLADLQAKQTERGLVLTLGDVLFEYDKAELKPGAMQNLYQLVTFLKENPQRNIIIEGHTDSIGSDSYNLELSQQRAQSVHNFLLQNGVPADRIVARGYGEAFPVTSNNTEAGRQQNRRVEVVILNEGEVAARHMR